MYKIVTGKQMAEIDRTAIEEIRIGSAVLMENAGQGVCRFICKHALALPHEQVCILCGKGNNGGDGLVIARLLYERGRQPQLMLFCQEDQLKGDAALNWERLPEVLKHGALRVNPKADQPNVPPSYYEFLNQSALIVDAVFGTGFQGELSESWQAFLSPLIHHRDKVLSVDIPSGVNSADGSASPGSVQARWTMTMGLPKVGQLLSPGMDHTGYLEIVDIGFPEELTRHEEEEPGLLDASDIIPLLPRRTLSCHKGAAGKLLVVGGSPGKTGAAAMCSDGAIQFGAGLVTLGTPRSLNTILEIKLTEVMTFPLAETESGGLSEEAEKPILDFAADCSALAIGPGLGRDPSTFKLICSVLKENDKPVVLDADGIYGAATNPGCLKNKPLVMTPHPGELAHFMNIPIKQVLESPWEKALQTAEQHGIVVVLKGAKSVIASPDGRLRINPTANPAMASAGMGDVLTGMVAALLTQGLQPFEAAQAAVFCHGLAGDLFVSETGYPVALAGEVLEYTRDAYSVLTSNRFDGASKPIPPRLSSSKQRKEDI